MLVALAMPASAKPERFACPGSATEDADELALRIEARIPTAPANKAFAKVVIAQVPGLRRDGTLDHEQKLPAAVVVLSRPGKPLQLAWWFHEHGDPSKPRHSIDADAFAAALREEIEQTTRARSPRDPAARRLLAAMREYEQRITQRLVSDVGLAWEAAGTIVDLTEVDAAHRAWVEADIKTLAASATTMVVRDAAALKHLAVAAVHLEAARGLAPQTATSYAAADFALVTDTGARHTRGVLAASVAIPMAKPGMRRLYVEGTRVLAHADYAAYDRVKTDVLVRFTTSMPPLAVIDAVDAGAKLRDPVFVIGLPSTVAEVTAQRLAPTAKDAWLSLRREVARFATRRSFTTRSTKAELLAELQAGSADTIVVYAHSDGRTLYLGGDKITLADLEAAASRIGAAPRTIVLVSCMTGRPSNAAAPDIGSFAQVLLAKGFATSVVAPAHAITGAQAARALATIVEHGLGDVLRRLRGAGLFFQWFAYRIDVLSGGLA